MADIALVNALELEADCLIKNASEFVFTISNILNSSILSTSLNFISFKYHDLIKIFFKKMVNMLLKYRSQGLNLKILDILPFKLLYNLFQVKSEVF